MIKKFLKITGCIVLAAVLLGLAGYYAMFKPDMKLQKELKAEFGEEFFEMNSMESGTAAENSQNNDPAQAEKVPQKDTIVDKVAAGIGNMTRAVKNMVVSKADVAQPVPVTVSPDNAKNQAAPVRLTQEEITGKYTPQFQSLQNQSASRLEALYSAGEAEKRALSDNGTLNRTELARKYIQAGSMLESSADSQFYSTLNAMQAELIANDLPLDIINDIESAYISAKAGKRSEMLGRAGL
jgi:hypothetical protein